MTSFVARDFKKIARRKAQAAQVAQRTKEDDDYFWDCVDAETRNRNNGKFQKPSFATQSQLFEKQGTSGINFEQYDSIPVSRSGPDSSHIPSVENFNNLKSKVPKFLFENLTGAKRMNYVNPTPIQRHTVPLSLSGQYDVMACAQTGSGKTVAFLVPLIAYIASNIGASSSPSPHTIHGRSNGRASRVTPVVPSALIVAPTRELAIQIELEAHKLTFASNLHCVCVYGGAPTRGQLALLAKGVDILVATPGRLTDFLQRGLISLKSTIFLVLDEADRMLDMGFEPQIRQICEGFDLPVSGERRTLMFSATFPDQVQNIAQKYLRPYVFVAVGRVGSTTDSITQRLVQASSNDKRTKFELILPLIDKREKTLIFCQKKHVASWIKTQLMKNVRDLHVDAIHGDRSQSQRESALSSFRDGNVNVLVATDVAARGLDVPNIAHVIQFDLPVSKDDFDNYVHRIGRTGRAGRLGIATSLYVPGMDAKRGENGALWTPLHTLLVEAKQDIPNWFMECNRDRVGDSKSGSASSRSFRAPQKDARAHSHVVAMVVENEPNRHNSSRNSSNDTPISRVNSSNHQTQARGAGTGSGKQENYSVRQELPEKNKQPHQSQPQSRDQGRKRNAEFMSKSAATPGQNENRSGSTGDLGNSKSSTSSFRSARPVIDQEKAQRNKDRSAQPHQVVKVVNIKPPSNTDTKSANASILAHSIGRNQMKKVKN